MSLAEIRQSVGRARVLMEDTGPLDISRGLSTDGWDHNIREARRELGEVADLFVRSGADRIYGEMSEELRHGMWSALLLSSCNAGEEGDEQFDLRTGRRIMSTLRARLSQAQGDLTVVTNRLAARPTGFPVRVLRRASRTFREGGANAATRVEQQAREEGDPAPIPPSLADSREYVDVMMDALRRVRRIERSWEAHHAGTATFVAMAGSALGVSTDDPSMSGLRDDVNGRMRGSLEGFVQEGSHTAGPMKVIGAIVTLREGLETNAVLTDPRARLRHCVAQAALARVGDSEPQAHALVTRLRVTEERLNTYLRWLARHPEHPAWVPRGGQYQAVPQGVTIPRAG